MASTIPVVATNREKWLPNGEGSDPALKGVRDAAVTDIEALQDRATALETNSVTAQAQVNVPLSSFRLYADATALVPFNDGVADGYDPTAESIGYRFNPSSSGAIAASVPLPQDLDDAAAIVVHILGYRVGSADPTAAVTVAAFFRTVAAAFSADDDAGGDTSAFAAATTVVSEATLSIAAGDVPAAPGSLLLKLVPTSDLDADDLVILEVWLEYTRKVLTS